MMSSSFFCGDLKCPGVNWTPQLHISGQSLMRDRWTHGLPPAQQHIFKPSPIFKNHPPVFQRSRLESADAPRGL